MIRPPAIIPVVSAEARSTKIQDRLPGVFALILAVVLVDGMMVSWLPLYWAVTVAQGGVLLMGIAWAAAGRSFRRCPLWAPVALVGIWGVVQAACGITLNSWITMQSALTWLTCVVAFLLASTVLHEEHPRQLFLTAMLWSVSALALIALLQTYSSPFRVFGIFPANESVVGTFLYKNQFAAMLELAAPIALYRMITEDEQRWTAALCFGVMFGAAVASASRAGVLLLTAELGLALIVWWRGFELPLRRFAAIAAGFTVLIAIASLIAGPERILAHFQEANPYSVRWKLLESTLRMIRPRPLFGYGLGTWNLVYPAFASFDSSLLANEAHNDWAQWTAEGGIVFSGLLLYVTLRLVKPAVRSLWGIGVIAVMVHSLVDYPTREPVLALFWFSMAGAVACNPVSAVENPRMEIH